MIFRRILEMDDLAAPFPCQVDQIPPRSLLLQQGARHLSTVFSARLRYPFPKFR